MHIPEKVKIGGYWLKVKFVNMVDAGETGASISFGKNLIQIAKFVLYVVMGKKVKKRVSRASHEEDFCHEILHGIDITFNEDTLTEKQVNNMGKGLYQVIIDNPGIFSQREK
jgi:hypothetical protein